MAPTALDLTRRQKNAPRGSVRFFERIVEGGWPHFVSVPFPVSSVRSLKSKRLLRASNQILKQRDATV